MEGLIRELKAVAAMGNVGGAGGNREGGAVGWTPADFSLGRSPLVPSLLQCRETLSQGSLKYAAPLVHGRLFGLCAALIEPWHDI